MVRVVFILLALALVFASPTAFASSYRTSTSVWDLQQQLSPVTLGAGAMYVSGTGIRISGSNPDAQASFLSTDAPFPVNNVVPSWNVDMPSGTGLRIEIRAVNGGTSTAWYELARQGTTPGGSRTESDNYGFIDWDTLKTYSNWPRIEYRVTLYTDTVGVTPTLRLMSLCYADDHYWVSYVPLPNPGVTTSLTVPWRSQYWSTVDPDEICGPTSMALAMAYNGCSLSTETVALETYDSHNKAYGNWPFIAQEAARHGFKSYYSRSNGQQPLRDFIAAGVPVEIGMAYGVGQLTNSPIPSTGGHLLLCVGITANGDYICNDCAGSTTFWDHVVYLKAEVANVWLGVGGTTIPCIPNSVYWRFPYYSYKSTDPISTNKNGIMELFANGVDGQMYHIWQMGPNGGWSSWTAMGGNPLSDPVAVTNRTGGNSVFARFTDGNLYYNSQNGSGGAWSGWSSLGAVVSKPSVGKSPDGRMDVFCRMSDGTIQHRWENTSGGWQAWASLGGNYPGYPVVGLNWEGREEVFVRGADNQLYHCWQLNDGTFSGWASLGGTVSGEPTVGKLSDGRLEVYCRFTDGTVQHNWQNTQSVGTAWGGWSPYSGTTTSNVVAARTPGFIQEIYCSGSGGSINRAYQTSIDGGWSAWESLGGAGLGAPIVGHNEDGRLQVFLFQSDGKMWSRWQQTGGGWSSWTAFGSALFQENVSPVISSVTTTSPALFAENDPVMITATVSDNVAVTEVKADGHPLTSDGAGLWTGSVPAAGTLGLNHVQVVAKDALGNTDSDSSLSYNTGTR